MQFQVPQFIEAEDKIVGPLSLRQFLYVAAAGGFGAMLYFSVGGWVFVVGTVLALAIAGAMCFVKIGGRPFLNVMLSAFNFYWKPQLYVWQPEHPAVVVRLRAKVAPRAPAESRAAAAAGAALHKTLATLQTGEHGKESDRQYLEKQMEARYQIFRKETGEKRAAKRVDYR
jgi:hypothetical protein